MSRRIHQFVDPTPTTRACPRGCTLDQHAPACSDTACSGCLPRSCTPGRWLCSSCLTRLRRDLDRLPRLYDELEWMLHRHTPGLGHRVSGGETPLYVAEPVVEWRHQIAYDARWWAVKTAGSRRVHPPPNVAVRASCRFLAVHADWATTQPWAHALAEVMAGLAGRAYRLAYPNGRRRVPVGGCRCLEDGCTGTLTALIAPLDDLLPAVIQCGDNPEHVWPSSDWLKLGRRLREAA